MGIIVDMEGGMRKSFKQSKNMVSWYPVLESKHTLICFFHDSLIFNV